VVKRSSVCYPDRSISARQNACRCICSQAFACRKNGDSRIAKAIHAIRCYSPYDPFSIFEKGKYRITGQPISVLKMVHHVATNSEESFAYSTYPETAVAVKEHRIDDHFAAIKSGRHKWLCYAFY